MKIDGYDEARLAWTQHHGSERLRKIERLGLLGQSDAVYRDERLAKELPGWRWYDEESDELRNILNPSMEALDALENARVAVDRKAQLDYLVVTDTGRKTPVIRASYLGRSVLRELSVDKVYLEALVERVYASLTYEYAAKAAGITLDDTHKAWLRDRANNLVQWMKEDLR